jgi:hypothetical protein
MRKIKLFLVFEIRSWLVNYLISYTNKSNYVAISPENNIKNSRWDVASRLSTLTLHTAVLGSIPASFATLLNMNVEGQ